MSKEKYPKLRFVSMILQVKNRLLLWYSWAYMELRNVAHSKTYIKHTRRIACWNGCAGTKAAKRARVSD